MDLLQLLTRRPAASVMDPNYVSETDASQPLRGLLKTLLERTVDVPAAGINATLPGLLMRAAGAKLPVPSEQAAFSQGSGPGYEFGRAVPDAVLSGLLLGNPAASAGRRAPANQVGAIKVYHGSPHKFDKFDSSKIGTGEGAQAYGHGGYFAEAQETAKQYATDRSHVGRFMHGTPDLDEWDAVRIAQRAADVYGDNAATHLQNVLKANSKSKNQAQLIENAKVAEALSLIQSGKVSGKGNLYEASLRWPDPAREARDPLGPQHFLDWDKPLSQQPEAVRSGVRNVLRMAQEEAANGPMALNGVVTNSARSTTYATPEAVDTLDGAAIRDMLQRVYGGPMLSERLAQQGVPGITYLDAGSRAAGAGTRNYVAFSDELIDLLTRNGQPIAKPLPAPAAVNAMPESALRGMDDDTLRKLLLQQQSAKQADGHIRAEIARRNAVSMLGLPEQNTAADRARALGFTQDAYHGTGRSFSEFRRNNPGMGGNVSNGTDSAMATFTSTNPKVSNDYALAGAKAENNMVLAKGIDAARGPNKDEVLSLTKQITGNDRPSAYDYNRMLERLVDNGPRTPQEFRLMEIAGIGEGRANILPLRVRGESFKPTDFGGQDWSMPKTTAALRSAQEAGADGAKLTNIRDGLDSGDVGTTYAVLDPKNIRSRFAAFDPARRDSADILAGLAGTGLLSPLLLRYLQDPVQ